MPSYSVQMSGARDYTLTLTVNSTQNQATNTSTVTWSLVAAGSWGSFGNDPTPYSVNIAGNVYSGTIPSFNPNPSQVIRSGSTAVGHNSAGNAEIGVSGFWNSGHSNIGQGTVSGTYTLPRIPKPPAAPTPLELGKITPTSMEYRFSGNSNNGAAITEWQAQLSSSPTFATDIKTSKHPTSGVHTFTGLKPGTVYYARSRGVNSAGTGAWSTVLNARTLSGAYVRRGNSWVPVEVLVYRSGKWVSAEVLVYRNGAWVSAS